MIQRDPMSIPGIVLRDLLEVNCEKWEFWEVGRMGKCVKKAEW